MTTPTPKPGEIWLTETAPDCPSITVWNGEKWEWLSDRKVCDFQGRRPVSDGPIAYTAEYMDSVSQDRDFWKNTAEARAKLSDQWQERAESAEAALKNEQENWLAGDLETITRDEPWRVLRAAAETWKVKWGEDGAYWSFIGEADRLEREATDQSERDRLIGFLTLVVRESVEKVASAFLSVGILNAEGVETLVNFDFSKGISAAADALLADKGGES